MVHQVERFNRCDVEETSPSFDVCLDEITKKDSSKEKILTQAQRARFDTIFPNYIERFRRIPPVVPANAAQSNSGSSMTTNDPSNGLATNDGNLPSKCKT